MYPNLEWTLFCNKVEVTWLVHILSNFKIHEMKGQHKKLWCHYMSLVKYVHNDIALFQMDIVDKD